MNVNDLLTREYAIMDTWSNRKNEPKTNPNEPKLKKAKMNVNKVLTVDYVNKPYRKLNENKPNTNPTCSELACPEPSRRERSRRDRTYVKGKKMCLDTPKILTINNMGANLRNCIVFRLFIERTLFGR